MPPTLEFAENPQTRTYPFFKFSGVRNDTNLQRVGQFHRAGIENDLQGYTLMTWQKVFGSPGKEYQLFLMQMRQALRDKNVHGYMRVRFITARKP
ncbi:hypothetical protein NXS19_009576 [Fusarium pseudograminearum]|nr:hypothetical protein NXS19_009576 [Fusarium pseudograminearum]